MGKKGQWNESSPLPHVPEHHELAMQPHEACQTSSAFSEICKTRWGLSMITAVQQRQNWSGNGEARSESCFALLLHLLWPCLLLQLLLTCVEVLTLQALCQSQLFGREWAGILPWLLGAEDWIKNGFFLVMEGICTIYSPYLHWNYSWYQ